MSVEPIPFSLMASDIAIIRMGLRELPDLIARPIVEKMDKQIMDYAVNAFTDDQKEACHLKHSVIL